MSTAGFRSGREHIAGETHASSVKQTMLFLATLEGDAIKDFCERLLEDPVARFPRQSVNPRA